MKALIAMSGGVDSSVAAYLMCRQNFDCIGCTMKLYNNEDIGINRKHTCCSLDDVEDARSVAYKLGMPYYVFNFTDCFKDTVIEKFVKSYENGITVKSNILYSLCKNILYSFSEWSSRGSSLIRYIFLNSKTLLSMLILPILNCLKNKLTQLSI